jgi:hypothetical protein
MSGRGALDVGLSDGKREQCPVLSRNAHWVAATARGGLSATYSFREILPRVLSLLGGVQ